MRLHCLQASFTFDSTSSQEGSGVAVAPNVRVRAVGPPRSISAVSLVEVGAPPPVRLPGPARLVEGTRKFPSSAAVARAASSLNRLSSPAAPLPLPLPLRGAVWYLRNADPLGGETEGEANGETPPSSLVGGLVNSSAALPMTEDGDVDVARDDSDGLDDHGSPGRIVHSLTRA